MSPLQPSLSILAPNLPRISKLRTELTAIMSLPPVRYTILDGGMGTTLEDSGHNVSSNLWSSDPALRSAVRDVHAGFLDAGAEMIGTATYQACESLYTQDGAMSSDRAHELMLSQVGVAEEAVRQAIQGRTSEVRGGKVGLCLGPFGATLQPGQEYSGLYPPPYGPSSSSTTCPTVSSYTTSLTALREFHLSRLLTYAQDRARWDSLDWVCFETIPLLREALAIRLAMRDLEERLDEMYGSGGGRKKWWMAYVFPSGRFPDGSTVKQVVAASVLPRPWDTKELGLSYQDLAFDNGDETSSITELFQNRLPVPQAIGINCTSPAHIRQLSRELTQSVEEILSSGHHLDAAEGDIGFVLYPDGGLVYNTTTRSWSVPNGVATAGGEGNGSWARNVAIVAREVGEATRKTSPAGAKEEKTARVWAGGVLVGGCCKNGFGEIKGLRDELKPREG